MVVDALTGTARSEEAGKVGPSTFIETAPESFKPIEECSKSEIAAEIMALLSQAESMMDGAAEATDVDGRARVRSLLYEAKELGDYLNV